jgi:hypothetical protein
MVAIEHRCTQKRINRKCPIITGTVDTTIVPASQCLDPAHRCTMLTSGLGGIRSASMSYLADADVVLHMHDVHSLAMV